MLLLTTSSSQPAVRALCNFTLALTLFVVTVSAQGRRDSFIIRVAELSNNLASDDRAGDAQAGEQFNLNFGNFAPNAADTLGDGAQTELQAPDVVVEGLNVLQRNNLVAAAGNALVPLPQQNMRRKLSSGLRRR